MNDYNKFLKKLEKSKDDFRKDLYISTFCEQLANMFEYQNVPETLDTKHMELYMICDGVAGVTKQNGNIIACAGGVKTPYNAYYEEQGFHAVNHFGSIDFVNGVDGVIFNNTAFRNPDYNIYKTAELLASVDLSQILNINRTRINPIVITNNKKNATKIEEVIKIQNSEKVPVMDKIKTSIFDETDNSDDFNVLNLVDYKLVECVETLSKYSTVIRKNFYNLYGMPIPTSEKSAQTNDTELLSECIVSMILPNDRLTERRKAVDMVNKLYGTNITVDFSPLWKKSQMLIDKMLADSENPLKETDGEINEST